jgi:hypothetical protein
MRRKLGGFGVSVLMVMAVGGLTAPPSFATDYFVKYLNEVSGGESCTTHPPVGPRHGSVVFRRTSASMFATIYFRNGQPNTSTSTNLVARESAVSCASINKTVVTDGNGNATVQLGPLSRKGKQAFWVEVCQCPSQWFGTAAVPAFGF